MAGMSSLFWYQGLIVSKKIIMLITPVHTPSSVDLSLSNFPNRIESQQESPLPRHDLLLDAPGTVGNLSYAAEEVSTARGRTRGMLVSDLVPSLADRRIDATSHTIADSSRVRARREALLEVCVNSRRIGALLGFLTAEVSRNCPDLDTIVYNDIARTLKELNVSSDGSLYSLKGAKYFLDTLLGKFEEFDLSALRRGVLNDKESLREVLDRISICVEDKSRMQASRVLDDIAEVVNQRFTRHAVHEPLWRIVDLLNADPVDGQNLHVQLQLIPDDRATLGRYFSMLTTDEFKALLNALQFERLDAAKQALSRVTNSSGEQSLFRLQTICLASDSDFIDRPPGELKYLIDHLKFCLCMHTQFPSSSSSARVHVALHSLSFSVKNAWQKYGVFPYRTSNTIRLLVEKSMDVFRDRQNNPTGPLNALSLGKLDEDTRAHLADAEDGLRSFGLALRPHVYGTWSYEREAKRI